MERKAPDPLDVRLRDTDGLSIGALSREPILGEEDCCDGRFSIKRRQIEHAASSALQAREY